MSLALVLREAQLDLQFDLTKSMLLQVAKGNKLLMTLISSLEADVPIVKSLNVAEMKRSEISSVQQSSPT